MYNLQYVRADHEEAILNFEMVNRTYFAASINDRGDDYFEEFAERHRELLADQGAGIGAFYVLVDDSETVVGRFNLYDVTDGSANVGYRVAQRVSGRGVASAALGNLCRIARDDIALRTLSAVARTENVASRRVLEKTGFVMVGATMVAGREGVKYELSLTNLEQQS